MKNPVVTSWTESTRNLFKPVIVLVITFAATVKLSQSLYRYNLRRRSRELALERCRRLLHLTTAPASKLVGAVVFSPASSTSTSPTPRHPFDSSKWGRICGFLLVDNVVDKNCIVEPLEASKNDLLVSCCQKRKRKQTKEVGNYLGCKACKKSEDGPSMWGEDFIIALGKGGGFCAYADISLCIHFAFERVMIIDLDAHQGNGHEMDFANDSRVYILDVYNPGIYPFDYEARRYIDQKVEVVVSHPKFPLSYQIVSVHSFDPELIVYNAGTDILDGDPLGRLKISPDGITNRDEKVFSLITLASYDK
ncbi:hypothetical protein GBA52_028656 [Prunus armeniaca]|nr:hypothetical protein GBA52_028656 [Prunus armeniaca]